jgi:hypothetical protein
VPWRFTILGDGATDRALKPIARWALGQIPAIVGSGYLVEFTVGRYASSNTLPSRIEAAIREFPCNILLVHRDAEKEPVASRIAEIETATEGLGGLFVPVVPVRMTEAWLLIDESAIRRAADNPNGKTPLDMPPLAKLEHLPDPKAICDVLLIAASEKSGRRRSKFARHTELAARRSRVADLIQDFSPLDQLPAFQAFRNRVSTACAALCA